MGDMNAPQPATQRVGQYNYKIFLFHSLSGRTPFWIRGGAPPGGPVGLFPLQKLHIGEVQTVTGSNTGCQYLSSDCKLLINMVLLPLPLPGRLPGTLYLRNLVERRSLLFQLVRRDFEQRFVGSAVGWIWGLIHPLVLLLSWVFVFQIVLKLKAPEGETGPYALYIFAGMLPWLLFSETVQRSAPSLLDQANLITKTVFPAEIVPVSVFLSTLMSHLLALALIVLAELWMNQISILLIFLPLYMLAIGLFAVGVGWIVAS